MSVSTRKHLEALREADQRALEIKQRADEKALELARDGQTYRDEQANRLREQIAQERIEARERESKLLTKEEYDRRHEDLQKAVGQLITAQAEGGGRSAGFDKLIAYGIGAAAVAVAVISQLH